MIKQIHLPICESTQTFLLDNLSSLTKQHTDILVTTDLQTDGKGRSGNKWDHFEDALAFSFTLSPFFEVTFTSLELGVLLTMYFKKNFQVDLLLKWPNDILTVDGKKCGGIICNYINKQQLVVGIGINFVENKRAEFDTLKYKTPVGSVFNTDEQIPKDPKALAFDIYNYIKAHRLTKLKKLIHNWQEHCIHLNADVEIDSNNVCYQGEFKGIGKHGEALILLRDSSETKSFLSGHLNILGPDQDLKLTSYDYELPKELIADRPVSSKRHNSKLLVYYAKEDRMVHTTFLKLTEFLTKQNLLVLNQSKVYPCRLLGKKTTGGKCELFLLSLDDRDGVYNALVKTTRKKQIGDQFLFNNELMATLECVEENGSFGVSFNVSADQLKIYLDQFGKIPIPPYIRGGESDDLDRRDYQTIYAKDVGSVAAPTAGLHFSSELFVNLEQKGIEKAYVTLHVGQGTFAPVKNENILNHKMHSESFFITFDNLLKIKSKKDIIAVGTTSLRVLESALAIDSTYNLTPNQLYNTDIFLHPGKDIGSIKGLLTNFHLPKSTLLMLVSTLIGRKKTLQLYQKAIENKYRFFSYGDAMLILL
ncbi:MAG: tRNA preQ1(34) S-adenosylmethionine ribosyltransferase-isomerase QueA [Bacteriovoracaceae bacterium]|nr:tRNA preQ1(34) S-adenosylmethionine ribosyltransferase-isomerase QueA [Bacteriovoracaceae bacterium]